MTVSSTQNYIEYSGDGTTASFTVPFYFLQNSDISAMIADEDGNVISPVYGSDYSVSGQGNSSGGLATFNYAVPTNSTLLLYRDPPATQETKYYENGKFPATSHEAALDKLTMLIQERGWSFDYLALKKPTIFSKFYDAKGNRIANLADPKDDQDAVTKSYADNLVTAIPSLIDSKIAEEASARQQADNALEGLINNETEARQKADANIQEQLTGNVPLEASAFSVISWHKQTVDSSVTIPANMNAWSIGPKIKIAPGQKVTISEGSYWTIPDGREVTESGINTDYGEL